MSSLIIHCVMPDTPYHSLPLTAPTAEQSLPFGAELRILLRGRRFGMVLGSVTAKSACDKCMARRSPRHCVVDDNEVSCQACRLGKTACDRKMRFLFESTRNDFFPSRDLFDAVFKLKNKNQSRTYQKTANKRRKAALPYCKTLVIDLIYMESVKILRSRNTAYDVPAS
ncbi:hypothetical protein C8J57DRAFT_1255422 [Mycena rebaudengoi]|nr:hypothetical protein C8J57DRAFT_1255422 [Mycena rebaudengoi]